MEERNLGDTSSFCRSQWLSRVGEDYAGQCAMVYCFFFYFGIIVLVAVIFELDRPAGVINWNLSMLGFFNPALRCSNFDQDIEDFYVLL